MQISNVIVGFPADHVWLKAIGNTLLDRKNLWVPASTDQHHTGVGGPTKDLSEHVWKNYGKSPCSMGKLTHFMAIFNSLPSGYD